jgi:hypothetical protein
MWPDPKPRERDIKRLAKEHGCCRKIGRAVGFTDSDVEKLLSLCSASTETRKARIGMSVAPSPDAAYAKALKLLTETAQKRSVANEMLKSITTTHSALRSPQRGAKR